MTYLGSKSSVDENSLPFGRVWTKSSLTVGKKALGIKEIPLNTVYDKTILINNKLSHVLKKCYNNFILILLRQ